MGFGFRAWDSRNWVVGFGVSCVQVLGFSVSRLLLRGLTFLRFRGSGFGSGFELWV